MSAWERSRFIPWDRTPLPDTRARAAGEAPPLSLEDEKERIFRRLHRDATEEAQSQSALQHIAAAPDDDNLLVGIDNKVETADSTKIPYSHMDLLKQAAFGGCIGTITGAVFGFMDGMRTAGESKVLQNASNMAKGKFLMQGTTRSASIFGVFFSGFHMLKYAVRVSLDTGDLGEIAIAAPLAMGGLFAQPSTRTAMPYGAMLVLMDSVSLYMKKSE